MSETAQVVEAKKRKLLPPVALLLSLLAQIPLMVWYWPPKLSLVPILLGVMMIAAGLGFNLWADRSLKQSGVGVRPFSPAPALVTKGPYRFTRNPMYLGMVLVSASVPLVTGWYLNFFAPIVLATWLHFRFVLPEEEFLRGTFGQRCASYMRVTPRWL